MQAYKENKKLLWSSFLLLLFISAVLLSSIEYTKYTRERERILYISNAQASKLQYIINTQILKTDILKLLLITDQEKVLSQFDSIAQKLIDSPAIRSLQLAPKGTVTHIYPLEGNEAGFIDLFEDPLRATEAQYARDSKRTTMSGPFDLRQGGMGLVVRNPVYLKKSDGASYFWGFTIIVLDLPEAFLPGDLKLLEKEGYDFTLSRLHPDTNKNQIFYCCTQTPLPNPVQVSIELPNASWTFSVAPKDGWIHKNEILFLFFIAFFIDVLLVLLEYAFLKLRYQKKQLRRISLTDPLTGLPNRLALQHSMEQKCIHAKQNFAFFYMDLNKFKPVNDTLGHDYGDLLLQKVAQRLKQALKQQDHLYRIGGDEFVAIIAYEGSTIQYEDRLKSIQGLIAEPFQLKDHTVQISVSIGYAAFPEDGADLESLMKHSDQAMYRMKNQIS